MNRAERRARRQWQIEPPERPWETLLRGHSEASEAYCRFSLAMVAFADVMQARGLSEAQAEAANRLALPAAAAMCRLASDMDRLAAHLAGISQMSGTG